MQMPIQRWLLPLLVAGGLVCVALLTPSAGAQEQATPNGAAPAEGPAGQPLTLEQAIATALAYNPRVYQARQDLAAARAAVIQAEAARSLTADLQVLHTRISEVPDFFLPVPAPPPDFIAFEPVSIARESQTQATLTIAKPLFTGGRVPALIRQSRAGASATSEEVLRTYQTVVSDAQQAYYGVLVAADLVRVAEDALTSAREHLRVARARHDAGAAPWFDVLRAETRVADSEQSLIAASNGLELARAALNHVMGIPQGARFDLTSRFAQPSGAPAGLAQLIEQAEASRPEIRQVRASIEAAGAAADLARSDKQPTLGLAWLYNRTFDTGAFDVASNWTLALSANLTLFNGKQTSAAVARALSQQESARGLLEQLRQGIALQVRQAYLDLNSAQERITAAAKGVEQAHEALRIAHVRYQAGVGISLEVIDAEVALAGARNQHARAVYDYSVALSRLELAVGASRPPEDVEAEPIPVPAEAPARE